MKKALLFFVCATTFFATRAQVKFGAKAGLNIANIVGDDTENFKTKLGFNVGAFADIPVSTSISVKPELLFSLQGAKMEGTGDGKLNLSYIAVPVLAKYHSTSGFFAETGPQIGFLTTAKYKYDGGSSDAKDDLKSIDFAWAFGLGYEIASGFGVNARYNLGLSKLPDSDEGNAKNSVFQIGIFKTLGSGAAASK